MQENNSRNELNIIIVKIQSTPGGRIALKEREREEVIVQEMLTSAGPQGLFGGSHLFCNNKQQPKG